MNEQVRRASLLVSTSKSETKLSVLLATSLMDITTAMMMALTQDLNRWNGFRTRTLKNHRPKVVSSNLTPLCYKPDLQPLKRNHQSTKCQPQSIVLMWAVVAESAADLAAAVGSFLQRIICISQLTSWTRCTRRELCPIQTFISGRPRSCARLDIPLIMKKQSRKWYIREWMSPESIWTTSRFMSRMI